MNKVILCGRMANDPVLKTLENGTKLVNYSLAIPVPGKKDTADFIACTVFNDSAEFANEYFKKGIRILIEGHIKPNNYTNKEGSKVYTQEVIVEKQYFADGSGKDETNKENPDPVEEDA